MSLTPTIRWRWRFLRGFFSDNSAKAIHFAMVVDVTERCHTIANARANRFLKWCSPARAASKETTV